MFSNEIGIWNPNDVTRQLARNDFTAVWVVAFAGVLDGEYTYNVTRLDGRRGNAPTWRVRIVPAFDAWQVEEVQ